MDASPTSTYSGNVIINGQKDIYVRASNDINDTASVTSITSALCIAVWGQSNSVGRGDNNQVYSVPQGAPIPIMYRSGSFSQMVDPTGLDGLSGGSLWPLITQKYIDNNVPVCIANLGEGGTNIGQWGVVGSLFARVDTFASSTNGLEFALSIIGESDSASGTTKGEFKAEYLAVVADINANYGCDTYAVYFPVGTSTGTTENVNAIRGAYDELVAENNFIKFGGDLSVIDISSASGADNLHLKTDAQMTEGANIIYSAISGALSTLTITATGIPDGIYNTVLVNSSNEIVHAGNVTYSSGQALLENLALTSGTPLTGFVVDNEISHSDGAVITGTTV